MRLWFIQIFITALLGFFAHHAVPIWNDSTEQVFLLIGFLSVGLFHGSADLLLIRKIRNIPSGTGAYGWGALYFLVILLAAAFLWKMPQLLLVMFLLGSAFHFGESQMWKFQFNASPTGDLERWVCYLLWGTWSMATPILLHPGESREILSSLGAFPLADRYFSHLLASSNAIFWQTQLLFSLALLSLSFLHFRREKVISWRGFLREVISFLALQWVFHRTSVLISFGAYFIVWHSLSSLVDQIHCLEGSVRSRIIGYIRYAFPNWLISAGMVSVLLFTEWDQGFRWSKLTLIFGAAILLTPPHLLVIHLLHSNKLRSVAS